MPRQLTTEEQSCLRGCSKYAGYYVTRKHFEDGTCAFCQLDRVLNVVLYEDEYWMVWKVPPKITQKKGVLHHILVVPKRHIRAEEEMTDAEAVAYVAARRWVANAFNLKGGATLTRFLNMELNVGTIQHLHFNIMEPDPASEGCQKEGVRLPIAKSLVELAEDEVRSTKFAKLYEAGEQP